MKNGNRDIKIYVLFLVGMCCIGSVFTVSLTTIYTTTVIVSCIIFTIVFYVLGRIFSNNKFLFILIAWISMVVGLIFGGCIFGGDLWGSLALVLTHIYIMAVCTFVTVIDFIGTCIFHLP